MMERFTLKFKLMVLTGLCLAVAPLRADIQGLPGASDNPYMNRHIKSAGLDRSALRDEVDETQAVLDSLARETRRLDKKDLEPLFKSLSEEYHLPDYVGKARKFVEEAEDVLDIQDAIKAQQARMAALGGPENDQESSKLLGLQSDLVASVDRLRDTLREVHSNANEDATRDLRNWIMISEGLLRQRREDGQAKAAGLSPTAAALSPAAETPLSAAGISPPAESLNPAPTPKAGP
jgi:hypothetical protein